MNWSNITMFNSNVDNSGHDSREINRIFAEELEKLNEFLTESKKNNINVLALLNVTTDTRAFHDCILDQKAEIYFIKGRIKFIKDGILSTQASQHPSCFVCWRRQV